MNKRPGNRVPAASPSAPSYAEPIRVKVERPGRDSAQQRSPKERVEENRVYGMNACRAAFEHRPQDLRKAYLVEARIPALQPLLAWCVKHRIGYRVVETADLDKLTQTQHHEGVCFDMVRRPLQSLAAMLVSLPSAPQPASLVVFDGVGNPHNFGAVLRSAAHFGVAGLVVSANSGLSLSGSALRVAEGGAEAVPVAQARSNEDLITQLHQAGFLIGATVAHSGNALYQTTLPARLALLFGAEGSGLSRELQRAADLRLTIPGTGAVESLNIAASAAVVLGEYYRQHVALK